MPGMLRLPLCHCKTLSAVDHGWEHILIEDVPFYAYAPHDEVAARPYLMRLLVFDRRSLSRVEMNWSSGVGDVGEHFVEYLVLSVPRGGCIRLSGVRGARHPC